MPELPLKMIILVICDEIHSISLFRIKYPGKTLLKQMKFMKY